MEAGQTTPAHHTPEIRVAAMQEIPHHRSRDSSPHDSGEKEERRGMSVNSDKLLQGESSDDKDHLEGTAAAVRHKPGSLKARTHNTLSRGNDRALKHHILNPNWWTECNTIKPHAMLDITNSVHTPSYTGRKLLILPAYHSLNKTRTTAVMDSGAQSQSSLGN